MLGKEAPLQIIRGWTKELGLDVDTMGADVSTRFNNDGSVSWYTEGGTWLDARLSPTKHEVAVSASKPYYDKVGNIVIFRRVTNGGYRGISPMVDTVMQALFCPKADPPPTVEEPEPQDDTEARLEKLERLAKETALKQDKETRHRQSLQDEVDALAARVDALAQNGVEHRKRLNAHSERIGEVDALTARVEALERRPQGEPRYGPSPPVVNLPSAEGEGITIPAAIYDALTDAWNKREAIYPRGTKKPEEGNE